MSTEDREFHDPTAEEGGVAWQQAPGYPPGEARELILNQDEAGRQTRLLDIDPGVETDEVLTHDFYEEVLILAGGLVDTRLEAAFTAGMYAYRTPGMEHGPYAAPVGARTVEFRYPE